MFISKKDYEKMLSDHKQELRLLERAITTNRSDFDRYSRRLEITIERLKDTINCLTFEYEDLEYYINFDSINVVSIIRISDRNKTISGYIRESNRIGQTSINCIVNNELKELRYCLTIDQHNKLVEDYNVWKKQNKDK